MPRAAVAALLLAASAALAADPPPLPPVVAPGAKVVWGMTTPVRVAGDLAKLDADKNARAAARNQIAAGIMEKNGIPVTDLYAALADRPDLFADDGVHHNAKGRELLAGIVADAVEKCLPKE